jgi:hypothetical protein
MINCYKLYWKTNQADGIYYSEGKTERDAIKKFKTWFLNNYFTSKVKVITINTI